jgi:hypothetical protein
MEQNPEPHLTGMPATFGKFRKEDEFKPGVEELGVDKAVRL